MKVKELLAAVRDMKATTQSDGALIRYLNEIEGMAQTEVMGIDTVDVVEYTQADMEAELLIVKPHSKLYVYYVLAMVDFGDGEYKKYENGMQMANSAFGEWAKWWQRTYGSRCTSTRNTVFLSAYGIAVKHGYTGSEEEWLKSLKGEKGDPFTYEDFTEEQLQALKDGVVQDALDEANAAVEAVGQILQENQGIQDAVMGAADNTLAALQDTQRIASEAARYEQQAGEKADEALRSADAAAKSASSIAGMTVQAETLTPGSQATASAVLENGVYKMQLGIPTGKNGVDALVVLDNSQFWKRRPVGSSGQLELTGNYFNRMPGRGETFFALCDQRYYTIFQVTDTYYTQGYDNVVRPAMSYKSLYEYDLMGAPGEPGKDGDTPYVGGNGNWWIGDSDTGIPAAGKTPVKGTDYWTEEDKQEIVDEIVEQIPPTGIYRIDEETPFDFANDKYKFGQTLMFSNDNELWPMVYAETDVEYRFRNVTGQGVQTAVLNHITGWSFSEEEISGEGGASDVTAIIDVLELPETDINEGVLYRMPAPIFVIDGNKANTYTCYSVDGLPEVGEPATTDMTTITAYYNVADGKCYGYLDAALAAYFGIPVGWYGIGDLLAAAGVTYSGVVYSIKDAVMDGTLWLLVETVLFTSYEGQMTPFVTVGLPGEGMNSEVFNHYTNKASGDNSHAEGLRTTASGNHSHAEGHETTASGEVSHAEGYASTASGHMSHAEGGFTEASGEYSHAEGHETVASGYYSHSEGFRTKAASWHQHVQGKYNVIDDKHEYVHIVGNGSTDGDRSNAHTIDWNGVGWFATGLKVGGTGQNDEAALDVVAAAPVTTEDNGKFLRVVDGKWAAVALTDVSEVGA